jgi:hypothetical protein
MLSGKLSSAWGEIIMADVGDFRDMHCSECGKKTEHVYGYKRGGWLGPDGYYYWECTECEHEVPLTR